MTYMITYIDLEFYTNYIDDTIIFVYIALV